MTMYCPRCNKQVEYGMWIGDNFLCWKHVREFAEELMYRVKEHEMMIKKGAEA